MQTGRVWPPGIQGRTGRLSGCDAKQNAALRPMAPDGFSGPCCTRDLTNRRVQPVPDIDLGDGQDQRGEVGLVVVA